MSDLLILHLQELVSAVPPDCVILAGGLGLMLKRRHLAHNKMATLALSAGYEHPEARVTTDIDLFLRIELFTQKEEGRKLRQALNDLHYKERIPNWQFEKPLDKAIPDHPVVVDLLARHPTESENVKVKSPRVGIRSGIDLHGRETIEAFAVEHEPKLINILDEGKLLGKVFTAHPYALLNMKIRAAHDWLQYQNGPWELRDNQLPPSAKHAFDAALIVAMVTEIERNESRNLAKEFKDLSVAQEICEEASELFGSSTARGWRESIRQGMFNDHSLIWTTLKEMLGIDN